VATESSFARDLGYLDKFFVNISTYANQLPAADQARLKQLMTEETQRWAEIRGLLGAGPRVAPASSQGAPVARPVDSESPVPQPTVTPMATIPTPKPAKERPQWTVGGLFGQPKK
jgi:hypothetical protein